MLLSACAGSDSTEDSTSGESGSSGSETEQTQSEQSQSDGSNDGGADAASSTQEAASVEDLKENTVTETALEPQRGGTLRYAIESDTDGLNPGSSAFDAAGFVMASAVFDTLAVFDENDQWQPYLAESFTPNEDFTVWSIKLREGITFHDGTPLNAEAIILGFKATLSDPLVGLAIAPFVKGGRQAEPVKIDEYTASLELNYAMANFPSYMAGQLGFVASPTWLQAAKQDPTLNQHPIGTGPFVFESRSEDSVTRMVRNEDYWNGEVYLDAIEFVPVSDSAVRTDLFLSGEVHGLHSTSHEHNDELRNTEGVQNILDDTGEETFLMMNTSQPPFDDIRARQALTYATPKQNYLDLITFGIAQSANQMFTPQSDFYNPDVVQETDVPEKAAPLVAEYCSDNPDSCTDGKINMEFQYPGPSVSQNRIADIYDQGWSPYFNVTFQELPQDQHIQEVAFGLWNATTWRQFGNVNPGDDWTWMLCDTIGGISLNWPRYCDESRDQLLFKAQAEQNIQDRVPHMQEVVAKMNEAYTYIFLVHTMWDNAFAAEVHGVCDTLTPEGDPRRCTDNGRVWFSSTWIEE